MRYFTNINNIKCLEWGLNANQGALFDLLNQASSWAETHIIDNEVFYHVSRNLVLEELPLFFTKSDTVYRNFIDLQEKGLIEYKKVGKKDVIKLTEKGKCWNAKLGNESEKNEKFGNKSEKTRNEIRKNSDSNPTNNNINNNYINHNIEEDEEKKNDPLGRANFFFDSLIKNHDLEVNEMAKEVLVKEHYTKLIKYDMKRLKAIVQKILKVRFIHEEMRNKNGNDRNFLVWIVKNIALIEIDQFQDYQKKDGKKNEKFTGNSRGEPDKGWGQFN